MSLKYAILGFLSLEPMSGYDLKTRHFDTSVAHFWPANQGQIYRTLDAMEKEGLVDSVWEIQTDRPNRKQYQITDQGLAELKTWLAEPRPWPPDRIPFLVQLYFSRHLTKADLLTVLQDQKQQHEARLAYYQAFVMPPAADPVMTRQLIFGGFTLDFGKRYEQMLIDWLAATIAQVEQAID